MSVALQKSYEKKEVTVTNRTAGEVMLSVPPAGKEGKGRMLIIPPLAKKVKLTETFTVEELKRSNIGELISVLKVE